MKKLTKPKKSLRDFIKQLLSENLELSLDQIISEVNKQKLPLATKNFTKQQFASFIEKKCGNFVKVRKITVPCPFGSKKLSMYSIKRG